MALSPAHVAFCKVMSRLRDLELTLKPGILIGFDEESTRENVADLIASYVCEQDDEVARRFPAQHLSGLFLKHLTMENTAAPVNATLYSAMISIPMMTIMEILQNHSHEKALQALHVLCDYKDEMYRKIK
jgi:hypothetical protein